MSLSNNTSLRLTMTSTHKTPKKKVLVVGAGAAGMSCAYHLSQHPDKFEVTLVEASSYCGGQAFSIPLPKSQFGASWLNQGVQGGSYAFHHTMTMFARQGYAASPVKLQVSFGKDDTFWTNVYPTKLLQKHEKEAHRFQRMLKVVRWLEVVFALLPVKYLLRIFGFSREFANAVALPMLALFLGTGNYTPEVPSIILERLCTSPTIGMWYPSTEGKTIFSELPKMVVFPNFSRFYRDWQMDLEKRGVHVRLSTELTEIVSRDKNGVVVKITKRTPAVDNHNPSSAWAAEDPTTNADPGAEEQVEHYDEIVLCCLADTAKRLLGRTASLRESKILGAAKFSDDLTITHSDWAYMKRHYEPLFNPAQATSSSYTDPAASTCHPSSSGQISEQSYKPMYFIRSYPSSTSRLEMSFDCTNYQAQFPPSVPFEQHVFQTIFLNKSRDGHLWTDSEIDPEKIIRRDWWHQLCHSWTHYLLLVPWLWLLQGRRHTRFASSWTVVNAHEVAIISGIAAAVDLGADYPADLEEKSSFAVWGFRLYCLLVYGRWYSRKSCTSVKNKGDGGAGYGEGGGGSTGGSGSETGNGDGNGNGNANRDTTSGNRGEVEQAGKDEEWGKGIYKSMYCGPGVIDRERWMWGDEMEREN